VTGFPGFPPEAVAFFRALRKNNKREWFLPRKQLFEDSVKAPMIALVGALNRALAGFAPEYCTDPGKALYRFYRDTRFSKDKKPYKDHIAATLARKGMERHRSAGFYFSVSDTGVEVAGGVYMPEREELLAIRSHLDRRHEEFRRLLRNAKLRALMGDIHGDRLARVPKGFSPGHPAEDLLRHKQWYHYIVLDGGIVTTPALYREILARLRAMLPVVEFLNAPLLAQPGKAKARSMFDLL
jgi:uncharacterized protein (TIGR02453 family)